MTMTFSRLVPQLTFACLLLLSTESKAFVVPPLQSKQPLHQNARKQTASLPASSGLPMPPRMRVGISSSSSTSLSAVRSQIAKASSSFTALFLREFKELTLFQKGLLALTFVLGYFAGKNKPFWKRYTSAMDIPSSMFGEKAKVLRGRAVRVSDGDTIRFLHAPTWWSPTSLKKGENSSTTALPIRICTIDTPETAKFGKSGQPFGPEAKENLKSLLKNKRVNVRLLQRDQYSRGVAQVYTGRLFLKKFVDEQMLKDGLAEVYTGGGAVYGPKGLDEYLAIQEEAQQEKKGIWSQKNRESAAEYKKRTK